MKLYYLFSFINNSPYNLILRKQSILYGQWKNLPPDILYNFTTASFSVKSSEEFQGIQTYVTYVTNDWKNSEFLISYNNPINGPNRVSISNPDPTSFLTYFECFSISKGEQLFSASEKRINYCSTNGIALRVDYYVVNTQGITSPVQFYEKKEVISYIKITNDTPYKLVKVQNKNYLGYWDKEPSDFIEPFEHTDWFVMLGDGIKTASAKCSLVYSFIDSIECLSQVKIKFYKTSNILKDSNCKYTQADSAECNENGVEINQASISTSNLYTVYTYYSCSTDNKQWVVNSCKEDGGLLYIDFHLVENSAAFPTTCVGEQIDLTY